MNRRQTWFESLETHSPPFIADFLHFVPNTQTWKREFLQSRKQSDSLSTKTTGWTPWGQRHEPSVDWLNWNRAFPSTITKIRGWRIQNYESLPGEMFIMGLRFVAFSWQVKQMRRGGVWTYDGPKSRLRPKLISVRLNELFSAIQTEWTSYRSLSFSRSFICKKL